MERMPCQPHVDQLPVLGWAATDFTTTDWRGQLPVLTGALVTQREPGALGSLLEEEWREAKAVWGEHTIH